MRKPRKMLVIPKKKDNAKKSILNILEKKVPIEKIETELIGNEIVVWITTSQEKKVKNILKQHDIKSFTSDVLILSLPDTPGELAKIARILAAKGISVKDAHLILKSKKKALYGVTTSRPREASKIVEKLAAFVEKERSGE
ncbi:MAG: hypothetical protein QW112_03365 [Candidatus Micrarchaeia archaeon]